MFKDEYAKDITSSENVSMSLCDEEIRCADIDEKKHWLITDTITHEDGREEVREYRNTVVDDCSKLIACLMKGQVGHKGISYWAIGSGEATWSNDNPPAPKVSDTSLFKETFRKPITADNIKFLDANNVETNEITNKIQIKVTFNEGEANGELREFSLYGGEATELKDSGIMINRKTHGLIYKTSGMKLERIIRVVF